MKRRTKIILAVIAAVIIAVILFARYMLFTSPAPPDVVSRMTPQQKQEVIGRVEVKVREFSAPRPAATAYAPRQVRLTQDEANVLIRDYIDKDANIGRKLAEAGVSNVRVGFGQGRFTAAARVHRGGIRVPVTISADVLGSGNGQVVVALRDIKLGRMAAPADVRKQIADKLETNPDRAVIDLPPGISSVQIISGEVVLQSDGTNPRR